MLAQVRDLPLRHEAGQNVFVHAGIIPRVPLDEHHNETLVCIPHLFLNDTRDHDTHIVHGHTPSYFAEIKPTAPISIPWPSRLGNSAPDALNLRSKCDPTSLIEVIG
jgi:hypothetical protein